MTLLEEMIIDIEYILENVFDDIVNLLIINPYGELHYNKKDIELFWLYMTFCCSKGNNIRLEKEFKEMKTLNLFAIHIDDKDYINETKYQIIKLNNTDNYLSVFPIQRKKNQYYYSLKERLIYIKDILLSLYTLMKKNNTT